MRRALPTAALLRSGGSPTQQERNLPFYVQSCGDCSQSLSLFEHYLQEASIRLALMRLFTHVRAVAQRFPFSNILWLAGGFCALFLSRVGRQKLWVPSWKPSFWKGRDFHQCVQGPGRGGSPVANPFFLSTRSLGSPIDAVDLGRYGLRPVPMAQTMCPDAVQGVPFHRST